MQAGVGTAVGDAKLEAEGKDDEIEGMVTYDTRSLVARRVLAALAMSLDGGVFGGK